MKLKRRKPAKSPSKAPSRATIQAPGAASPRPDPELEKRVVETWKAGDAAGAEKLCWQILRAQAPARGKLPAGKRDKAEVQVTLARLLAGANRSEAAVSAVEKALALLPGHRDALVLHPLALKQDARPDEAVAAARAALGAAPDLADVHAALVACLLDLGRIEEAEDAALAATGACPGISGLWDLRGRVAWKQDDGEKAVTYFEKALSLRPRNMGELTWRIANIHHDRGDLETAHGLYRKAVALQPTWAEGHAGLVNVLIGLGRSDEAVAAIRRAMETAPGYGARVFDYPLALNLPEAPEPAELDRKRAVLVNGLGCLPNLPLGISCVKSYAEKNSDYAVRCVDLSAHWFRAFVEGQRDGSTPLSFDDSQAFVEAADMYAEGGPAFFDTESYERLSALCAKYFGFIGDTTVNHAKAARNNLGPLPWYVRAYARHVMRDAPFVVGFSVTFTEQIHFAALCARAIKALNPDVTVVFGGGFFNKANLEGFLAEPWCDYVVVHEGEKTFLDILQGLNGESDTAPEDLAGIAFCAKDGSFVARDNPFDLKHDLLPFADFSDYVMGDYFNPHPVIPIISSRGCYWRKCTFCDHFAAFAGSYKVQSIPRVVDEMQHHVETIGARYFTFVDEMISAKRFQKICNEILARDLDVRWYALAKPTQDFTPEILDLMYRAGCRCIYWGFESGSERVLSMMDKGSTVASSAATLPAARAAGIRNHLFLIVGFPSETREELRETLDFLHEHRASVDKIIAGPYVMKYGTPTADQYRNFGVKWVERARSLCNSKLVAYEAEVGMGPEVTGLYSDIARFHFFDRFCEKGRYFGVPRDHVVIMYSHEEDRERVQAEKTIPRPAEIDALLDKASRDLVPEDTATLVPVWREVKVAAE